MKHSIGDFRLPIADWSQVLRLTSAILLAVAQEASGQTNDSRFQDPPSSAAGETSRLALKEIHPGVFRLGLVTLNKQQRSVSWPVSVNQRTGVVEYAIVTSTGKTHESIFRTDARPDDIHIALLLLGGRPANTNQFPPDPSAPIPGDEAMIEVSWTEDGRRIRRPLEQFVMTIPDGKPLESGPWIYNGSFVLPGHGFVAQDEGSIVSVHLDPGALFNNPRPDRDNDDIHHVNSQALPGHTGPLEATVSLAAHSARPAPTNPAVQLRSPPQQPLKVTNPP